MSMEILFFLEVTLAGLGSARSCRWRRWPS
jgi:hypothetical protein